MEGTLICIIAISKKRRRYMPTIIVEADEGRTIEQKRQLVKDITDAVCKNFKVPADAVTIFIHEGKKENRGKAGKLASDA
jgi:4-oxalocrotonate tautomerase